MQSLIKEILNEPSFAKGTAWRYLSFQENAIIIKAGDEGKALYFIEQGSVRVTVQVALENNKNLSPGICDLNAGDMFGELSLIKPNIRTATVTALTQSSVIEMDAELLSLFLDDNPYYGHLFFKNLFTIQVQRLQRGNNKVETLLAWGLKAHGIDQHL